MELEIKFEYTEVARVGIKARDDLVDKKLPGIFKKSVGITTKSYMRLVEQLLKLNNALLFQIFS